MQLIIKLSNWHVNSKTAKIIDGTDYKHQHAAFISYNKLRDKKTTYVVNKVILGESLTTQQTLGHWHPYKKVEVNKLMQNDTQIKKWIKLLWNDAQELDGEIKKVKNRVFTKKGCDIRDWKIENGANQM